MTTTQTIEANSTIRLAATPVPARWRRLMIAIATAAAASTAAAALSFGAFADTASASSAPAPENLGHPGPLRPPGPPDRHHKPIRPVRCEHRRSGSAAAWALRPPVLTYASSGAKARELGFGVAGAALEGSLRDPDSGHRWDSL